jgi:hypothetical protein
MDLTTHYMGLQLKNPLVASASPLSADLGNIRHLEDSGAAAIVLPSIFEEQIEADRVHETLAAVRLENSPEARGHLPEANQREPQQYLDLIRRAPQWRRGPTFSSSARIRSDMACICTFSDSMVRSKLVHHAKRKSSFSSLVIAAHCLPAAGAAIAASHVLPAAGPPSRSDCHSGIAQRP